MPKTTLIKNATIINEAKRFVGSVLIEGKLIKQIITNVEDLDSCQAGTVIDATGCFLIPGMIDGQVHFREPGLTHKGDIFTESKAAIAGGTTSFMEMPNTIPRVLDRKTLDEKFAIGAKQSMANYSFYMGTSNTNIDEVLKVDPKLICGIKMFLGSSTGDMLVDDQNAIEKLLAETQMLIACHCEDEDTIIANANKYRSEMGEDLPLEYHSKIRNHKACYLSSSQIIKKAKKFQSRLHVLHLTTADEMELFDNKTELAKKRITAEVCVHHLWFTNKDYKQKGNFIKWNPSIKDPEDRNALRKAVKNNTIDIIATDHAPHTLEEKNNTYFKCPSGGPLVQHSLVALLEMCEQGIFNFETIVNKTSHSPAICFQVENRGFIREGYAADLVLFKRNPWQVNKDNILYKCGWSPFEGQTFNYQITHTLVNGHLVYANGNIDEAYRGEQLEFVR